MKIGITIERYLPYVAGIIGSIVWWILQVAFPKEAGAILTSSITYGAIISGFMATSEAILISLRGSSVIVFLHDSGYIKDLVQYIAVAIWLPLAFAILSIIGLFIKDVSVCGWFGILWCGVATASTFAFIRIMVIMHRILLIKPKKKKA